MPRVRRRTTSRGLVPTGAYARACSEVYSGSSVRQAALANNINHVTLSRYRKRRAVKWLGQKICLRAGSAFQLPIPCILAEEEHAGKDWFTSFMERSGSLSLQHSEATSKQRLSSFNQNNVNLLKFEDSDGPASVPGQGYLEH
ncbi:unnamed protein product [Boreogadus saida]